VTVCAVPGCENRSRTRGWCPRHYKRWRRHGDPTAGAAGNHEPHTDRIRRYALPDASGCWLWSGARNRAGYGVIGINLASKLAHRISYEAFVGPVPEGLELDHLCKTKACVNPAHLEPVTRAENVKRGWPDRKRRAELSLRS